MTKVKICAAAALLAALTGVFTETGRHALCALTSTQVECEFQAGYRDLHRAKAIMAKTDAVLGTPVADQKAFDAFLAE